MYVYIYIYILIHICIFKSDHSIRKIEHSAMAERQREKRKEKPEKTPDSEEDSEAEDAPHHQMQPFQLAKDIMDVVDPTAPNMIAFHDGKT